MKTITIIFASILFCVSLNGQITFKTVVSQSPVTVDESFQVQYVIENPEKLVNFRPPAFINFQVIAGPNMYIGSSETINGPRQIRNFVYTLVALKTGHFFIEGATAFNNGKLIRSNDTVVEVISKQEAARRFNKDLTANTDYFLRPGEDAYEKIKKNLFLKMIVDRKDCFVGQPVLATFKLYSRLESKSDIVKNPGFYGFTVHDMVNLADKQVATENVNGKLFDVHTIRKVQLYPFQPGAFTIDAMEVKNSIEFSHSAVNKKTEQEIVEGTMGSTNDNTPSNNTSLFETNISTEPIAINVKPVPLKNKPLNYDGATGAFSISASLVKDKVARNEEDILEIIISGKGNFIQLSAPAIRWPEGIEGFDAGVKDMLDKTKSPLAGNRTFRYPFSAAKAGLFTIPSVSFSFFNPDSGHYKSIATNVLQVNVSNKELSNPPVSREIIITRTNHNKSYWQTGVIVFLLCAIGLLWFLRNRKKNAEIAPISHITSEASLSINEILAPAYLLAHADDKSFYTSLQQAIWKFFAYYFHLSGSEMSKRRLLLMLEEKKIEAKLINEIDQILTQCETGVFGNANFTNDKNELLLQAKRSLEAISSYLL